MPDEDEHNEDEYVDDEHDPNEGFVPEVPAKYSIGMKFYLVNDPVYGEGNDLNPLYRGKVAEIFGTPSPNDEVEDWEYRCRIYDTDGATILKEHEDIYEREFARPFDINWEERMKRHSK